MLIVNLGLSSFNDLYEKIEVVIVNVKNVKEINYIFNIGNLLRF